MSYTTTDDLTTYIGGANGLKSLLPVEAERSDRIGAAIAAGDAQVNAAIIAAGYSAPILSTDIAEPFRTDVQALLTLRVCQLAAGVLSAGSIGPARDSITAGAVEARQWLSQLASGNMVIAGVTRGAAGAGSTSSVRIDGLLLDERGAITGRSLLRRLSFLP